MKTTPHPYTWPICSGLTPPVSGHLWNYPEGRSTNAQTCQPKHFAIHHFSAFLCCQIDVKPYEWLKIFYTKTLTTYKTGRWIESNIAEINQFFEQFLLCATDDLHGITQLHCLIHCLGENCTSERL